MPVPPDGAGDASARDRAAEGLLGGEHKGANCDGVTPVILARPKRLGRQLLGTRLAPRERVPRLELAAIDFNHEAPPPVIRFTVEEAVEDHREMLRELL